MTKAHRTVLVVLPLVAALIGIWLLVISPKKAEVSELDDEVLTLQGELTTAEDGVAAGESARRNFSKNYGDLVSLGAAAPEDDDQATLVYNLSRVSTDNDLRFGAFTVSQDGATDAAAAATPAPAATEEAAPEGEAPAAETTTTSATTTTTPVATEASAAALPIGATVGAAGLPVMSYDFALTGTYFDTADFLGDVDQTVDVSNDGKDPVVHGRLMTINGFSMALEQLESFPQIQANFAVTTYLVPAEQGIEAGATEAGPAPVGSTETPATVTSAETATATVSP